MRRPWVPLAIVLALASSLDAQAPGLQTRYRVALPGYRFKFPRDNFNHPDFQTEWWYYTGNLKSTDGHRFGFELTFFRHGVARGRERTSPWQVEDVYLAHLALSDIDGRHYLHTERLNRAGPGLAGAALKQLRVWNGNWEVRWQGGTQSLQAVADRFTLQLSLKSLKPPVINGENGVSQKAEGLGHASYYISMTRLKTSGRVTLEGKAHTVEGLSWMDHEFFTHLLEQSQVGWDWFSLELDDGTELMLYRIRRKDGTVDRNSAGTYVDLKGRPRHLTVSDFRLEPGQTWTSPTTHAPYPIQWRVSVPSFGLTLDVTTPLETQEFVSASRFAPSYWEGAIRFEGSKSGSSVRGEGYLEMTGYDRRVDLAR
jgi:predicted secreted hydrolase